MQERFALGFGNNIDYEIVWDSRIIEEMVIQYSIRNDELNINHAVKTERDLVISVLGFLKAGVGGERIVSSSDGLEQFSKNFKTKITLGGTSVRAAIAMRKLGYTSALHLVTVNDHVRRLIPQDSPYVCSNTHDSLYPHLIVQFGKGNRVKAGDIDIFTSQENRIIYHNDDDNTIMNLNEDFSDLITGAQVFLVSGFNAMRSEALLLQRLESLGRIMKNLPRDAVIFYEDGGYYNTKLRQRIFSFLAGRKHLISLNEDELQEHLGRQVDSLNPIEVKLALEDVNRLVPDPVIIVHTRHWALAYGTDAAHYIKALQGGITMATTRFCYGDAFTIENYREIAQLPANKQGAIFADEIAMALGDRVCCVPVALVSPSHTTTVGLGDAFVGGFLCEL